MCGHVNTENPLGLLESNRRHHPLELKLQVLLIYSTRVMCWEVNCGSLEEQAVLLILNHLSSLVLFVLVF